MWCVVIGGGDTSGYLTWKLDTVKFAGVGVAMHRGVVMASGG